MLSLKVIYVSTREGRAGEPIADWVMSVCKEHPEFDSEMLDLRDANLPLFDEPKHPKLREYTKQHTKDWSAKIDSADAFIFVTPEYNYSAHPALLNALDYLAHEWKYKPAAFVSYGGISGGLRGVQMAKQTITALAMMPIPEAVVIPFFTGQIEDGSFKPNEKHVQSAHDMLAALARWAMALKSMRT